MQTFIIPEKKSASFAAIALSGALCLLGLAACDKAESPTGGTDPNAKIVVSSPTAGQVYKVGDSLRVKWTVKDDAAEPIDGINVSLSPDGGITWGGIATRSIGPKALEWGNFAWKITDSLYIQTQNKKLLLRGGTQCKVRVEQYSTQDPLKIVTTAAFTIQ